MRSAGAAEGCSCRGSWVSSQSTETRGRMQLVGGEEVVTGGTGNSASDLVVQGQEAMRRKGGILKMGDI